MHCLKCGTEIESPDVFCETCLEKMKQDPVSRETPLILQPHPEYTPMAERKRVPKAEELLIKSQNRCKRLKTTCTILAMLCICLVLLLLLWRQAPGKKPNIGQNYVTEMIGQEGKNN